MDSVQGFLQNNTMYCYITTDQLPTPLSLRENSYERIEHKCWMRKKGEILPASKTNPLRIIHPLYKHPCNFSLHNYATHHHAPFLEMGSPIYSTWQIPSGLRVSLGKQENYSIASIILPFQHLGSVIKVTYPQEFIESWK